MSRVLCWMQHGYLQRAWRSWAGAVQRLVAAERAMRRIVGLMQSKQRRLLQRGFFTLLLHFEKEARRRQSDLFSRQIDAERGSWVA